MNLTPKIRVFNGNIPGISGVLKSITRVFSENKHKHNEGIGREYTVQRKPTGGSYEKAVKISLCPK